MVVSSEPQWQLKEVSSTTHQWSSARGLLPRKSLQMESCQFPFDQMDLLINWREGKKDFTKDVVEE